MVFRKPRYLVERSRHGYVVKLDAEETEIVVRLLGELKALIESDDPQVAPLLRRLFPPAYHLADDAASEAEYQKYMRDDLVSSRLAAIDSLMAALTAGQPLDDGGVMALMQAVNSVRLVLGTLLDVSEEHDPSSVTEDDPMVGEHHLYAFLSWMLESAVHAVSRG